VYPWNSATDIDRTRSLKPTTSTMHCIDIAQYRALCIDRARSRPSMAAPAAAAAAGWSWRRGVPNANA
jgi:hypothetical protein